MVIGGSLMKRASFLVASLIAVHAMANSIQNDLRELASALRIAGQ